MKFELNVYGKNGTEKKYETDSFHITYGAVQEFLDLDLFERLSDMKESGDQEAISLVMDIMPKIPAFVKMVFPAITEDEIARADISEIAHLIFSVFKEAGVLIAKISMPGNAQRGRKRPHH